jgi:AcrR family transcriptional regulator
VPFPRFYKLGLEQREQFMIAAAQEFAAHGFERSSVNSILERAHISKGRAYYYFEDKFDLFYTVMQYCNERLQLFDLQRDPETLDTENFWYIIADVRLQPLLRSMKQPWLFAATKAIRHLSPSVLCREPIATLVNQMQGWLFAVIKKGQELGVIRTDVEDDLLFAWIQAIDDASDYQLLACWNQLNQETITQASYRTTDVLRRLLEPGSHQHLLHASADIQDARK